MEGSARLSDASGNPRAPGLRRPDPRVPRTVRACGQWGSSEPERRAHTPTARPDDLPRTRAPRTHSDRRAVRPPQNPRAPHTLRPASGTASPDPARLAHNSATRADADRRGALCSPWRRPARVSARSSRRSPTSPPSRADSVDADQGLARWSASPPTQRHELLVGRSPGSPGPAAAGGGRSSPHDHRVPSAPPDAERQHFPPARPGRTPVPPTSDGVHSAEILFGGADRSVPTPFRATRCDLHRAAVPSAAREPRRRTVRGTRRF